jgi:hypothetical protein
MFHSEWEVKNGVVLRICFSTKEKKIERKRTAVWGGDLKEESVQCSSVLRRRI